MIALGVYSETSPAFDAAVGIGTVLMPLGPERSKPLGPRLMVVPSIMIAGSPLRSVVSGDMTTPPAGSMGMIEDPIVIAGGRGLDGVFGPGGFGKPLDGPCRGGSSLSLGRPGPLLPGRAVSTGALSIPDWPGLGGVVRWNEVLGDDAVGVRVENGLVTVCRAVGGSQISSTQSQDFQLSSISVY